jgi:predicted RNA-binding Zn ribbon-like protein
MAAAFQLFGGHPVLDLINTLDNRFVDSGSLELLPSYADLLRFARQSQILTVQQVARLEDRARGTAAARVLRRVHELREALAGLLYAGKSRAGTGPQALKIIERHVLDADAQRELVSGRTSRHANSSVANWSWSARQNRLELPLWILSKSAEALLTTEDFARVHACRRDACRWLFLDSSKNHSRRWCDMKVCGNRIKAQRFHARQGVTARRQPAS